MNNQDARVRITKEMLHKALLSLLKEKPVGSISVKELCSEAGINRGTFYLHYGQPEEVLKEIEDNFIDENMQTFDRFWDDGRNVSWLAKIYSCILQNRELCSVLMGENGDPQFMNSIRNLVRDGIVDEWQKEFPSYDRERLEYTFDFVFSGSMQLVLSWIGNDRDLSLSQFARRLERLGHYSLIAAGEF